LSRSPPAPEYAEPIKLSPLLGAERRHLTILSCDLVGSTALTEQLDPEDLGSVIRVYRERCAAAIARCGGHVASYVDDEVLAFFSYPHAREDAAERVVRVGLAIVEATDNSKPGPSLTLQVRVGIATGRMVNNQTSRSAQEEAAVGKPLNLATRLQAIAEPGTVIIAGSTRRLVGGLFLLEDLGCHPLEGFTAPVRAWSLRLATAWSRAAPRRYAGQVPCH